MTQQETTSSKKIAKKARKIFRKEMMNEAHEEAKKIGNIMRKKPKYVPWFIWMWGLSLFITLPEIRKQKKKRSMIEKVLCTIGIHDSPHDYEGNEVLCRRPGCSKKIAL